jgi:hypothetical protein
MYCHKCGREVPADALFCPFCGQQLDTSPPPSTTPSSSIPPPPIKPTVTVARPRSITLAAILCYIFGGVEILGGLYLIYLIIIGLSVVSGSQIPSIGNLIGIMLIVLAIFGFYSLVEGALYVIAGSWLKKSLRKGGILAITLSIIGIVISVATSVATVVVTGVANTVVTELILLYIIIGILINIAVIIPIAVGWKALR